MSSFIVHNVSGNQIAIIVPAPHRKTSVSLTMANGSAIDLVPFAGSLEACKNIGFVMQLRDQGLIQVEEIP